MIELDITDGVAEVVLYAPEKRNALDPSAPQEMTDAYCSSPPTSSMSPSLPGSAAPSRRSGRRSIPAATRCPTSASALTAGSTSSRAGS